MKLRLRMAPLGNFSQSYGASPAIWDHAVLPASQHRLTHLALNPAKQAGTRFIYPQRDGRLSWPRWLVIIQPYLDGLHVRRQSPIQWRPHQELAIFWS